MLERTRSERLILIIVDKFIFWNVDVIRLRSLFGPTSFFYQARHLGIQLLRDLLTLRAVKLFRKLVSRNLNKFLVNVWIRVCHSVYRANCWAT